MTFTNFKKQKEIFDLVVNLLILLKKSKVHTTYNLYFM